MIRNIVKTSFVTVALLGSTIPYKTIVDIKSCDKYQWCQLEDSNQYIKEYQFDKTDNNKYKCIYSKNCKQYIRENNKKAPNYDYGYTSTIKIKPKSVKKDLKINKYFLGLSTGLSKLSSNYTPIEGSFTNVTKPDTSGLNLTLEVGYKYDKTTFSTASINYIQLADVKLYNYLVSYNKKLENIPYDIYVGAVAGISYLELTKSPVANLPINDAKGRKLALGFQTGLEYPLEKDLIFFTQYQYLKAKHSTSITSGSASAKTIRNNFSNVSFGIRWDFSGVEELSNKISQFAK